MPADGSHTARGGDHQSPEGRRTLSSNEYSSDDEFPDILSAKFTELCQRYHQERLAKRAAEATDVAKARKAAEAMKITGRRDIPRRSPRIQAALRSERKNVVRAVRHSARIAAMRARSS